MPNPKVSKVALEYRTLSLHVGPYVGVLGTRIAKAPGLASCDV